MRCILLSINEESIFQSITADPIFARDAVDKGNLRQYVGSSSARGNVEKKRVSSFLEKKYPRGKGKNAKRKRKMLEKS